MAEYRFIKSRIWSDPYFYNLTNDERLAFIWLFTNERTTTSGIYPLLPPVMAAELKITVEEAERILQKFEQDGKILYRDGYVWVKNFLRHQIGITVTDSRTKKIISELEKSPPSIKDAFCQYYADLLNFIDTPWTLTITRREAVWIRDNGICQYCGKEINDDADFEVDHVIPLSKGGADRYDNMVCSCKKCSQLKGDKSPAEAGLPTPTPSYYHVNMAIQKLQTHPALFKRFKQAFRKFQNVGGTLGEYSEISPKYQEISSEYQKISYKEKEKNKEKEEEKEEKENKEEKEKKEIYKEKKEKEERKEKEKKEATLPTSLPEDIMQFKEFFNTAVPEDIRNSILDSLRNIFRKKSFRSARQLEMLKAIFEEEGYDSREVDATLKHITKIKKYHWLFNYGPPAYDRFVKSWNELKHFKPFIVKPEDIPDGFPTKEALFDFLDKFCENDKQVREVIKVMKYHKGMEDAWQMYEEYKRRQT